MYHPIKVTDEMKEAAAEQARLRSRFIHRRFVPRGGIETPDIASFIGEFCFRVLLSRDWREGIRANYVVADEYDEIVAGRKVDVKTSLRPGRTVLYNQKQAADLISKYDVVFWGVLSGEYWIPMGWVRAEEVTGFPVDESLPSPAHRIPVGSLLCSPIATGEDSHITQLLCRSCKKPIEEWEGDLHTICAGIANPNHPRAEKAVRPGE